MQDRRSAFLFLPAKYQKERAEFSAALGVTFVDSLLMADIAGRNQSPINFNKERTVAID